MEKIKSMPKLLKIVLIIVLIIALSGGAAAVYLDSKLDKISFNSGANTPMSKGEAYTEVKDNFELNVDGMEQKDGAAALPEGDAFSDNDVINILLLGTDMPIPGTDDTGRCDMTMLCSLNKKTGDVKLVGFERAIGVPVPKYEDDMLTHVFQYGGGEFMQETINKCFRVDVDAYIHVGYEMFPQVIDAIGGIDVELDRSEVYYMSEYLAYDPAGKTIHEGLCHLNGMAAYSFCRLRSADDDWGRQARVREAVMAMFKKLKDLSVKDINNIADTVLPLVSTNLTKAEIRSLIMLAPKFINAEVSQLMIPEKDECWSYLTGRGKYLIGVDYEACAKEIEEFLYS